MQPANDLHGLNLVPDMQNDYPMQTPSPGAFVTPSPSGYSHAAPPALPYRAAPPPRGVVASQAATPSTHPAPSPTQTGASNSQRWKFMDDTGKLRKVSGRLFSEPSATLRWVAPFHPASVHIPLHLHEHHCGVCLHFVLFLMSTEAAGATSCNCDLVVLATAASLNGTCVHWATQGCVCAGSEAPVSSVTFHMIPVSCIQACPTLLCEQTNPCQHDCVHKHLIVWPSA